jgi:hypothetical protein
VARFERVVAPGIPYHVIHHGNRRHEIFFSLPRRFPFGRGPRGYRFYSCKCELEARIGRSRVAGEHCDGSPISIALEKGAPAIATGWRFG